MRAVLGGVLALVCALLAGAVLIALVPTLASWGTGEPVVPVSPWAAYRATFGGVLGTREGVSWAVYHAGALVLTALAVAIPLRAGLFNIGGEGQLLLGGLAGTAAALGLAGVVGPAPAPLAMVVLVGASAVAAAAAGAAWGALAAAFTRPGRGANEVIASLLLNFVAAGACQYVVKHHLLDAHSGVVQTPSIPLAARLGRLAAVPGLERVFDPNTPVTWALPAALVAAVAVAYAFARTRWGYELRATGANPDAARAAGIGPRRVAVSSLAIGGACAGLASLALVHGHYGHYGAHVFAGQYGFLGLATALLGRGHPLGVVPAALLFGVLFQGASEITLETSLPASIVLILQALAITAVVAAGALLAPRGRG